MASILIAESSPQLSSFLKKLLTQHGYQIFLSPLDLQLLSQIEKHHPDLVLLDHASQDLQLQSFCWQIKKEYNHLPLALILDKKDLNRASRLYKNGADDFITKPINDQELLSRINMLLTNQKQVKSLYQVADLILNIKNFTVTRAGQNIKLTPQEFKLLRFLILNQGQVLSRDTILARAWSYDTQVDTRVVDVYIGYLRKKIDDPFDKPLIHTVRGFGYVLRV